MFDVVMKKDHFELYTLVDTRTKSRAVVCPERGGIVTAFSVKGREALYLDRSTFEDPSKNIRGGIPILFPVAGRLENNEYEYQGQTYSMRRHGFARDMPWRVVERSTTTEASLTLALTSTEETRRDYPFDFELRFTYRLKGNMLSIDQHYRNLSSKPMPFYTGFHPYFLVTEQEKASAVVDVEGKTYYDLERQQNMPYQGKLDLTQQNDVVFRDHPRPSAGLVIGSRAIEQRWSTSFKSVVVWTVPGKDYVCVEPFMAPDGALNTKQGLEYIQPNGEFTANVEITLKV